MTTKNNKLPRVAEDGRSEKEGKEMTSEDSAIITRGRFVLRFLSYYFICMSLCCCCCLFSWLPVFLFNLIWRGKERWVMPISTLQEYGSVCDLEMNERPRELANWIKFSQWQWPRQTERPVDGIRDLMLWTGCKSLSVQENKDVALQVLLIVQWVGSGVMT